MECTDSVTDESQLMFSRSLRDMYSVTSGAGREPWEQSKVGGVNDNE